MSGDEPLPIGRSVLRHDLGVSQSRDAPSADLQIDFRKLLFPQVEHHTEHCRAAHRPALRVVVVDETKKDLERQARRKNQVANSRKTHVPSISRSGKRQNLSGVHDAAMLAMDDNAIMSNHFRLRSCGASSRQARPVISLGINVQIA